MIRSAVFLVTLSLSMLQQQIQMSPLPKPTSPHHEANFEAERKQADELFTQQKPLEALPLYEDLCRQDSTIAVFAERHAAGLIAKAATLTDPAAQQMTNLEAMKELKRAQSLGDNSDYVRFALNAESKSLAGAVLTGVPLTVGYTYHGNAEAQGPFRDAQAAFGRSDWNGAATLYLQAAALDPRWYDAALYAGDTYFRQKDLPNASAWFAKAIAIDPDRETAYRYWGDALFRGGDREGARQKFVEAVVAEPYGTTAFPELGQWAKASGHQMVRPNIVRPEFTTPNGVLQVDPELAKSTKDGRSSWIVYQQYRVDHGARTLNEPILAGGSDRNAVVTPSGYRHTIAEEHAALRAMLADVEANLKSGITAEADLDVSVRNIRALEKANALGAWIAINAADAGIRSDYPAYRSNHRKHLVDYVNGFLIH